MQLLQYSKANYLTYNCCISDISNIFAKKFKMPGSPGKTIHQHIRRLSKAIMGALYPVQSDHIGQSFFDISAAVSEMIIVKPLIINVMMERKYQLVAWTEKLTDKEDVKLYMIPSLESEVQASLISDLAWIHKEEYKCHGVISIDLARRAVRAYENMSRFEILTGHYGDGIRYLFFAAKYCILEEDFNWICRDTDLDSYTHLCEELRHEFVRLCEEGLRLVKKYKREDILLEKRPKQMLKLFKDIHDRG